MVSFRLFLLLFSGLIALVAGPEKPVKLKPKRFLNVAVKEPSDLCFHPSGASLFMVSDNGFLYETDLSGRILRQADYEGYDCEGVWADEAYVYVVEERTRKIRLFDLDSLRNVRTVHVPYGGGRNKGYEAFCANPAKGGFVLLTEKDPIYLFELDAELRLVNEVTLDGIAADISAATWHDDHLWLLSDEDMQVLKLDPLTYQVLSRWYVPIINPEGLAFSDRGEILVLSDDMQRLYFFDHPLP